MAGTSVSPDLATIEVCASPMEVCAVGTTWNALKDTDVCHVPKYQLEFKETAPDPPGVPEVIDVEITKATVSWKSPEKNGGSPVTGYYLEYKETPMGMWMPAGDFKKELSATVSKLKANTKYQFRVSGRNAIGKGRPSESSNECLTKIPTVPDPPKEAAVSETSITSITLNWEPPEFDGGSLINGYIIEHRETSSATWLRSQQTSVTTTSCTVQGLNWMATFQFRVISKNRVGQSLPHELTGSYRSAFGKWKITNRFGNRGGSGKLILADGIARCPNTDVAVADYRSAKVKIYNKNGKLKMELDTKQGLKSWQESRPRQVKVNFNGKFFITDSTQHVKAYDANGSYERQFAALSPDNIPSDAHNHTKLCGLELDHNGELLVGVITSDTAMYISKHTQDGSHLCSINVNIEPHYLAVSRAGTIIISSESPTCIVQIIDQNGSLVRTLDPPADAEDWVPRGVFCSRDTIFVTNSAFRGSSGIYCYSIRGDFLCCITDDLPFSFDLVVTEDGNQMMITKNDEVLVFERNA